MTRSMLIHLHVVLRLIGPCLVVLVAFLGAWPGLASAGGFYRVAECSPGHTATPNATVEGTTAAYSASTSCAGGNWLQVQSGAESHPGEAKQWIYTAPPGTQIKQFSAAYNLVGDAVPDGNRSYLFIRRAGQPQQEYLSVVGMGSTAGTYDSSIQDPGPLAAMGVGVYCSKGTGTCSYAPGQFARLSTASFLMEDTVAPGVPVVAGRAADGEWVGGVAQIAVGETDIGAGIDHTTVAVDGQQVINDVICEPGQDANGYVGSMTPCDPIELRYLDVDTTGPKFHEGPNNQVRVCTHEYGFGAAATCTVKALRVDNVAPAAPLGLSVAGGSGWHRDNDFKITWNNPAQAHAPIAAATVVLEGPGGQISTTTKSAPGIESIEGLTVPAVGAYTASVYLRDAAGNESSAADAETVLKFDDTRPPTSRPGKANGWLSRTEVAGGYRQTWQRARETELPPSGVGGYSVAVTSDANFDPCAESAAASGCELTETGIDNNSRTLWPGDLVEGSNWVHVVPVSGSGMRAAEVGRTELKVDLTDPASRLSGVDGGWVNHSVDLRVEAEDALSGMRDTDDFPDDDPPRTVLAIDGDEIEEFDADVEGSVEGDGAHRVEFWARDLAGNENDGVGPNAERGSAIVRIDTAAPTLAFESSQDRNDPDRVEAPVADGLSGVAGGEIAFRERGSNEWRPLPTALRSDRLVARADSTEMRDGVTYEFRATATDRAGNSAVTTKRRDGADMTQTGPFRRASKIVDLAINGRASARVAYGRKARATGRLLDGDGTGIGGVSLEVIETYAGGSKRSTNSIAVRTAADGRFSASLPKGPSRTVKVRFAGNAGSLGTTSATASLRSKGAVTLRAPRRVRAGGRAVFRGKVKGGGADFGKGGKSLEIQVRIGRRWKTVGRSIHTDARGRFRLRYRFVADYRRPVRYRFRAAVLRERGWPYLPAHSRIRALTVVP
ncbi:MAG: hypothetical protein U0R51_08800 [Solirubrobacterales bacterium]